ncbi:MAG TPA: HD domain-containing phosphohydrolase [Thermoleophilia bacterium]|nr:HD domain-containing phosphohydrolase [Thermoleophilia bacterium]
MVDDELSVVRFLSRALNEAGYLRVRGFTDPAEVSPYLDSTTPDLVVLDLCMPGKDGFEVLSDISRRLPRDTFLPILMVSGMDDLESKLRAIRAGAKDFLSKPIVAQEFLVHVYSLLDTRFLSLRLNETRSGLQGVVQRETMELRQAHLETLERLGRVAEIRDDVTGQHTNRIGRLSALMAQELHLSQEDVELVLRAAPLHDIGKIAIADKILLKDGIFGPEEREIMQEHVSLGAELLSGGRSEIMQTAEQIALCHHERWDGQGYPQGLAGEDIPLLARIVAVADTFDALTHVRPYKEAWTVPEAIAEIRRERGWQFDPDVVDALVRVQRQERGMDADTVIEVGRLIG